MIRETILCAYVTFFCSEIPPKDFVRVYALETTGWVLTYTDAVGRKNEERYFSSESVCRDFAAWTYGVRVRQYKRDEWLVSAVCQEVDRRDTSPDQRTN